MLDVNELSPVLFAVYSLAHLKSLQDIYKLETICYGLFLQSESHFNFNVASVCFRYVCICYHQKIIIYVS